MKKRTKKYAILSLAAAMTLTCGAAVAAVFTPSFTAPQTVIADENPVATVGSTGYATIDDAIANWTNNSTLTLMADVTLSDVITFKSTEHHILNLGTYTMTAASGKHAIEITCEGRSSASYALTVNADAENPGGITATGKSCIYYKKSGSTKDRPIILINNGVFTGSYSLNLTSNGNTNCPQAWINGGTFNSYMNLTKCMLKVSGGTFHAAINCTGDSSAYRQISGGRFKSWQFMTADAANKFWVGAGNGNYNVGVYVDDEGYLVVGGDPITEKGDKFAICVAATTWNSALAYSSAAEYGLYYTSAQKALSKSNVSVLDDEINLTGLTAKLSGSIKLGDVGDSLIVKFDQGTESYLPTVNPKYTSKQKVVYDDNVVNNVVTRTYTVVENVVVAKVNDTYFKGDELMAMVAAIKEGSTLTLYKDLDLTAAQAQPAAVTTATLEKGILTLPKNVTINGNGNTITGSIYAENLTVNGDLTISDALYAKGALTKNGNLTATTYEMHDFTFTLSTDKTALRAGESLIVMVSINEKYHSAEYTLSYDKDKFTYEGDTDGNGEITIRLFRGEAGALATHTFIAKDAIEEKTTDEFFSVTGNVVEHEAQLTNPIESTVIDNDPASKATVTILLKYDATVIADYVPGNYSLVLITGNADGYAYNGKNMFFVEKYNAYAYIVAGVVTKADIDEALSKTTDCKVIKHSYDVNAEYVTDGKVDLKDATIVYDCSLGDFNTVEEYMEVYLRADVNGDYKVNMADVNEVFANYTTNN